MKDILVVDSHLDVPLDYSGPVFTRNDHGEPVLYINGNLGRPGGVIINRIRMREDKMEPVQYKGYTIQVNKWHPTKNWPGDMPKVFDYTILASGGETTKASGFNSLEDAITEARKFIDAINLKCDNAI